MCHRERGREGEKERDIPRNASNSRFSICQRGREGGWEGESVRVCLGECVSTRRREREGETHTHSAQRFQEPLFHLHPGGAPSTQALGIQPRLKSGDMTPCRMTRVTLHGVASPDRRRGISPQSKKRRLLFHLHHPGITHTERQQSHPDECFDKYSGAMKITHLVQTCRKDGPIEYLL